MDEPVVREGWPFVGLAALAAAAGWGAAGWPAGVPLALLAALVANFFRNPDRPVPADPGLVVAPADGRVVEVADEPAPRLYGGAAKRVSIFMNVLDVHVNRAPIAGRVAEVVYTPGRFLAAYAPKASLENEQNALLLEASSGRRVLLVQIAGLVARRIVNYARPGDRLARGQRFGLIRFGSRVDVYLPPDARLAVAPGGRVYAGSSVLAHLAGV
ncbi:MAG TPA: phosphatidylserine decarboxylase family protein [Thermodesulfobacteriota bacterium]|nr:phosphatidylserine decarboxylase family protein [Thermodesulfobacteriota bacterium]